jgi:hypothetical protein
VIHTAEILTSSIIVIGAFNPAIFSPDWLERNRLIGKGDADEVREGGHGKTLIVSHEVAFFETKWFALQVLEKQFSLTSKDALSPAFKDLAVGIFQLVPHTPVTAVGLNFLGHFKLGSEDESHRVGDMLAPKDIWKALYPDESPGLADLTIRIQPCTPGEPLKTKDEKRISVQPSNKLKFGAFLSYNDHHDVSTSDEDNLSPAERVANVIDNGWEPAWHDAVRVFDGVLSKAVSR